MTKQLFWIFLLSASPLSELRGSIPLGIIGFGMDPFVVFCLAVLGNFIIVPFALFFLHHISGYLMRKFYFFNRLMNHIFTRTRDHHAHKFEKWENWALLILVAIPFPLTGAWTGALMAFLFGIPYKKALLYIFGGIVCAGLIVTAVTLLGINLFTFF